MGDTPSEGRMVYFMENPIYKWMTTRGTTILGNLQMLKNQLRLTHVRTTGLWRQHPYELGYGAPVTMGLYTLLITETALPSRISNMGDIFCVIVRTSPKTR